MRYSAERLKEYRLFNGLSITELAKKSGVAAGEISKLERQHVKTPNASTVRKLAGALGKEIADFIVME